MHHPFARAAALIVAGSALALGACASTGTKSDAAIGHAAHASYVDAIATGDVDAMLAVMTDDVVFMAPGFERLVGKDEIRPWLAGYIEAYDARWEKDELEFVVAGDWAFEQYAYRSTVTPRAGGDTARDTGKGLIVWRRGSDGVWRVARDAWNSDAGH